MENELVSIIMPVHNAEKYVRLAIDSILTQVYKKIELILVDDASSDGSKKIIKEYEAKYPEIVKAIYLPENRGVSFARNTALKHCQGEFICFADADDIHLPERIAASVAALRENPDASFAFVDCEMINEAGESLHRRKGMPEEMNTGNALLFQLKRNHMWIGLAILRAGIEGLYFDEDLPNAEDYELFLRLLLSGEEYVYIDEVLVQYRTHGTNISRDNVKSSRSVQTILSRSDFEEMFNNLSGKYNPSELALSLAIASLNRFSPELAEFFLEKCTAENRQQVFEQAFYHGICAGMNQDWFRAKKWFETARDTVAGEPTTMNNIGVCLAYMGFYEEAVEYFARALELCNGYSDATFNYQLIQSINEKYPDECCWHLTPRILRSSIIHQY